MFGSYYSPLSLGNFSESKAGDIFLFVCRKSEFQVRFSRISIFTTETVTPNKYVPCSFLRFSLNICTARNKTKTCPVCCINLHYLHYVEVKVVEDGLHLSDQKLRHVSN
jgi:hypothetical protein